MKKQISKLILLMVPIMLLFSCNKDKFSEKDALNSQQTVDLLVTVIDASTSMAPVDGATVVLVSDSTIVTKTTNANGIVVFPSIKIGGEATVSVSKTDFTSVLTTVSTNPDSYRQTQVSAIVNLYSIDPTKMATFQGRLTMQSDLTNRNREPAAGFTVKAKNNNLIYSGITGQLFTAVTDADGKYSISVPVSSSGDNITLYYPDFTTNQTLAIVKPDNSIGVVTRSVLYSSDNSPLGDLYNIPAIPSVYATVAAPPAAAGSGFALSSKANRVLLSSYATATLIDGGAGYNGGVSINNYQLTLSPDPHGVSAKLQVDITGGKITNIDWFIDNGATYSSTPTLNQNGATTPAVISINFQPTYKIYISNRGTGYNTFPLVSVETETYNSGTKVIAVDPDINDWSTVNLGNSAILSNYATIYGGIIRSKANGDTLLAATSYSFASAPVFTVVNPTSKPAILTVNTWSINADSTVYSIDVASGGSGYNPDAPPAVTLTTLAGYGSGAVAKATVDISGAVSGIFITNPGMKYVQNVNDYKKSGNTGYARDFPDYPNTNYSGIKPGDIIVQDVYYGTGYQILNQNTGK
jgi:hypothetical protein